MRKVPFRTFAVSVLSLGALGGSLAIGGNGGVAATSGPIRLVIGYRHGAPSSVAAGLDQAYGLHRIATLGDLNAQVVTVGSTSLATRLFELRHQPTVAYAQVDSLLTPQATPVTPNDPYFSGGMSSQEWGETRDQANYAWSVTTGSNSVTIAVIDSGISPTQPDLQAQLVPGWNVLTNSSNTTDTYGHGTKVAGVAAAATNNGQGVAGYCWGCRLMPIKVYNTSAGAYQSNVASGITWAVDHGANVINISLAGTSDSTILNSAVSYAISHGVTVVAAAGDSGLGGNPKEYPAGIPGVISVAGSQQTDSLYSYSESGSWVDIAAPGGQVTTLNSGSYLSVGGTSIAAPAVSGIVGLMLSVDPAATTSQIDNALFTTTQPLAGTRQVAYGRVNAYQALLAIAAVASSGSLTQSPPSNVTAPTISGAPQQGNTLIASPGSWSGTPTSYGYQWFRCGSSGCSGVSGATSSAYVLGSGDVGYQMKVRVSASDAAGSGTATSASTATITPLTSTGTSTTTVNPKRHKK